MVAKQELYLVWVTGHLEMEITSCGITNLLLCCSVEKCYVRRTYVFMKYFQRIPTALAFYRQKKKNQLATRLVNSKITRTSVYILAVTWHFLIDLSGVQML